MGAQNSKSSSVIDTKFLKSLALSTPLKKTQNDETEVHQINCLSHQHQQIMLDKIRIKKNYDCPYIIKIIDSHTLESKSLCSTIIKTYIVVQKPQSLADEIQQRIQLKMGFQQAQIWTLIYSCCLGASYLLNNNVELSRLTPNKIFIDVKGGIKIIDPDFSQGALPSERIAEEQFVQDLSKISRQLLKHKTGYSESLRQLIDLMTKKSNTLNSVQNWVKTRYLDKKKQNGTIEVFSSAKKSKKNSKSKQKKMIKVTSNKKNQNSSSNTFNSHETSQIGEFTNFQSLSSYRCGKQNRQVNKNSVIERSKNRVELFTFKDPLKDFQNINKQIRIQSHLFPRKALFGGRSKNSQKLRQTVSQQGLYSSIRESHKQVLTRESNSMIIQTDPSLDQNQIMNMISYQVDQQTFVRQICQEQSYYFLQLMNQGKSSSKSSRN